ncbi:ABC transporter ATP-binding protein [Allorhizocola rhizosphaerae]|uniref:ABC transporter ATP-binding protein n=1 Tax=Allorhizocola rhizosphaerae TaxID=1872709 RepID=UPI0014784468|nr:ABC transporter ATP-binding protein [Allorhizocola rhizosphaerae]
MFGRLRQRQEWKFFSVLPRADRPLATAWWALMLAQGLLPAGFAIAIGWLVGAVQEVRPLGPPLVVTGLVFVAMQVVTPIHQVVSNNLGDRVAAWLYDRLTEACVEPPGMGHLEDPEVAKDMTTARDFDLGMTAPPLSMSLDFIAGSLAQLFAGVASALILFGYAWWAPLVLGGAWFATHWLLRESAVWRDRNTDEVRAASQDADYAYRLAVDPPASKELRLFGLVGWVIERFAARRKRLHQLQYEATRMRERSVLLSLLVVLAGNVLVFWSLGRDVIGGGLTLGELVVFAQAAIGASLIAFGGLNWALDGASAPVAAVLRLKQVTAERGALSAVDDEASDSGGAAVASARSGSGAPEIRFRGVDFAYPGEAGGHRPILQGFDLTIPAGSSLAIVGRNGAGKTTLAKLICRLYDPVGGAIEADGRDIRRIDVREWRSRVTAVFQDFVRFELSLRENVAPNGAPDEAIEAALKAAGADGLASLDTILAKGYDGGTDLSGGQWQRVALARALCAVRQGAGVVLLDEPTAQLDVRGEAEIFERILAETRHCTTILVSHRFSTVRQADRICVLEEGRVVELGSHEELMAQGGRYRTMFDLQAQRFAAGLPEDEGDEEVIYDVL